MLSKVFQNDLPVSEGKTEPKGAFSQITDSLFQETLYWSVAGIGRMIASISVSSRKLSPDNILVLLWLSAAPQLLPLSLKEMSLASPGWPRTPHAVKAGFRFLIISLPSPKYWDYRHAQTRLAFQTHSVERIQRGYTAIVHILFSYPQIWTTCVD